MAKFVPVSVIVTLPPLPVDQIMPTSVISLRVYFGHLELSLMVKKISTTSYTSKYQVNFSTFKRHYFLVVHFGYI